MPYCPSSREPRAFLRKVVGSQIPANGGEPLAQFLPVAPVPPIAKRAEPVVTVRLADDSPRPDYLPTLSPPVTRSTDLVQSAEGWGQFIALG